SLSIGITAHGFGEYTIETTGDDEKDHIEIDFEPDSGRQRIQVKEAHGIGQRVFNEHALSVSRDQLFGRQAVLVAKQNRGFVMAQILNEQLSECGSSMRDLLFVLRRWTVRAVGVRGLIVWMVYGGSE